MHHAAMNLPTSMSLLRPLRRAIPPTRLFANQRRHDSSISTPKKEHGSKRVIFSGIQPTGVPHLGNYLGALRQWVKLQDEASPDTTLLFSIVDLHAITIKQDPVQLAKCRKEMLASLLAVGLDPRRCIIFAQSSVKQHAELMWILSCGASMGYLGRMTQWKVVCISNNIQEERLIPTRASCLFPTMPHHSNPLPTKMPSSSDCFHTPSSRPLTSSFTTPRTYRSAKTKHSTLNSLGN
jgi:hypothetical protein